MVTAVEATIQAIVFVVQVTPLGTNLGLANLMWAMSNGSFLLSRGAIFPALQFAGLDEGEMRRSWAAMRNGSWATDDLVETWGIYVAQENEWQENRHEGLRVIGIDLTGFSRPRLQGWAGKHYHSLFGKAIPAVVFGVMTISGRTHGKRVPLLHKIIRCQPEQTKSAYQIEVLRQAVQLKQPGEVNPLDAGFKLSELATAGLEGFVLRLQVNCTARRTYLPAYKGAGRRPEFGEYVRPLERKGKQGMIAATKPDHAAEFEHEERTIKVEFWHGLVSSETKVADAAQIVSIYVFRDPHYTQPLILATDLELMPETVFLIYRDRWPVEHPPLAAKQMIGLHRQFVFSREACFRLPELALLVGNMLAYVAAVSPPIPTGFWDRKPQATPGRLRRRLGEADFPNMTDFDPQVRKKNSPTDHLPKGVSGHRRQKRAA